VRRASRGQAAPGAGVSTGDPAGDADGGRERTFALLLTAAFAIWVTVGLAFHEMWRDEFQAWFFALESPSVGALLERIAYEGHPPLWHLLLWVVTRLTSEPAALQLLQGTLAVGAVWILARHAPFPRWQRALLASGYFVAYEYALIARPYGLGMLLLFAVCAHLSTERPSPVVFGLLLALLANTTVYGAILALALAGGVVVQRWLAGRRGAGRRGAGPEASRARADAPDGVGPVRRSDVGGRGPRPGRRADLLGAGIFAAGLLVSVVVMTPPADASFQGRPQIDETVSLERGSAETLAIGLEAYLPVPRTSGDMALWRTARFTAWTATGLTLLGGATLIVMAVFLLSLLRRPGAATTFVLATGGILLFAALLHRGSIRHYGHLYLALVAAMWLGRTLGPVELPGRLRSVARLARPAAEGLFVVVLLGQVVAAVMMARTDLRYDFSGGESAARFIRASGDADLPVAVLGLPGQAVAGYLGRPVYQLDAGVWGRAAEGDARVGVDPSYRAQIGRLEALVEARGEVWLVANDELQKPRPRLDLRQEFWSGRPIVPTENYRVYRVGPPGGEG